MPERQYGLANDLPTHTKEPAMSQTFKLFPNAAMPTRTERSERNSRLPEAPQLYRSEAVGEDLADLYPMLAVYQPTQPRSNTTRALLAGAWVTTLVLATVVAIHSTLA
jgi:hypothetical protein